MRCFRDKSFLRYKLRHLFQLMDINNDGTVMRKDFTDWNKKGMDNMEAIGYEVTVEYRKKLERIATSVYNTFTLYGLMAKNKKRFAGFMSLTSQMLGFKIMVKFLLKRQFKLYDFDDSGDLSLDEYVQFFCRPIGISEDEAKESFKLLDTD